MKKPIFRKEAQSTSSNRDSIISLINDKNTVKVILFATVKDLMFDGCTATENNNLPFMVALVEQKDKTILHDGVLLVAARKRRYYEMKDVLDAAIISGKTAYCNKPVKCTSKKSEDDAVEYLLSTSEGRTFMLDHSSRSMFFPLLSSLTEVELSNI